MLHRAQQQKCSRGIGSTLCTAYSTACAAPILPLANSARIAPYLVGCICRVRIPSMHYMLCWTRVSRPVRLTCGGGPQSLAVIWCKVDARHGKVPDGEPVGNGREGTAE